MKPFLGLALLVFVLVAGWRIGSSLDSDALGMAIGMFFGILAGIPTALFLLAAGRRHNSENHRASPNAQPPNQYQTPYPQPPVIIVTSGQPHGSPPTAASSHQSVSPERPLPDPRAEGRKFRVVGESEEWLDEW